MSVGFQRAREHLPTPPVAFQVCLIVVITSSIKHGVFSTSAGFPGQIQLPVPLFCPWGHRQMSGWWDWTKPEACCTLELQLIYQMLSRRRLRHLVAGKTCHSGTLQAAVLI